MPTKVRNRMMARSLIARSTWGDGIMDEGGCLGGNSGSLIVL